ncbi:MAG: sulfatase-like hydrolase/transferase [Bacteroidales bacterium]
MKQRFAFLIKVYIWFVFIFVLLKPLFMLYHNQIFSNLPIKEFFNVIRHGFEMDISVASYFIVPLIITTAISIWITGNWVKIISKIYLGIITAIITVIAISDLELYSYWGFRIDSTPLFYLTKPAEAFASIPVWKLIAFPIAMILCFYLLSYPFYKIAEKCDRWEKPHRKLLSTFIMLLIVGVMIIPIRGGIGTSTMSIGRAYYSTETRLNNAAVNPVFSLLSSLMHENDFSDYARYMDDADAESIIEKIGNSNIYFPNDTSRWIKNKRPNIIMVILESFSSGAKTTPDGRDVMPNLTAAGDDGINFSNFFANSFRTDRGLFSIIDGFPALPTLSVMKYPAKMQSMPSLTRTLHNAGYKTSFLYGGDADFTNMRSFFATGGVEQITSDEDLSVNRLTSKWGANDGETFSFLSEELKDDKLKEPFFKIFLTLSSHEPFDVPYNKFKDKYLNSIAYTDSCIGSFMHNLKNSRHWENTLIIFIADHGVSYLLGYDEQGEKRHRIPMIWSGGAVKKPLIIEDYSSQSDLPATLLSQMGIDYSDFIFSKNIADSKVTKFAYYTYPNGFGYIDDKSKVIFDCDSQTAVMKEGADANSSILRGKALLQKLYNNIK